MREARQPVPWEYRDVVLRYLRTSDAVLDIGTGGGERLRELTGAFGSGLGIDVDPAMVRWVMLTWTGGLPWPAPRP
jgi:SAM-dependent methyltransferase